MKCWRVKMRSFKRRVKPTRRFVERGIYSSEEERSYVLYEIRRHIYAVKDFLPKKIMVCRGRWGKRRLVFFRCYPSIYWMLMSRRDEDF